MNPKPASKFSYYKTPKTILAVVVIAVAGLIWGVGFALGIVAGGTSNGETWRAGQPPVLTSSASQNQYRLIKRNCWFTAPWRANLTCAELHIQQPTSEFTLAVVILVDESAEHRPDPVVYLQGGPGAGANLDDEGIASWLRWMNLAHLGRDIVLVDPRGTGHSLPRLNCPEFDRFNRALLKQSLSLDLELQASYQKSAQCFNDFEKNYHLSLADFSSQRSAADLRALMALLNYPEWNILAVSYGTRLALEVARQEQLYPQEHRLKAMVLDSVYPAGYGGVQTWPQVLDDAMAGFFSGCARIAECAIDLSSDNQADRGNAQLESNGTGRLAQEFMAVLNKLKQRPIELTVPRWDGEAPIYFTLNDHRFLSASFAAIYDPRQWSVIVKALRGVESNNPEAIKPLIAPYLNRSFNNNFNSLTFAAVDCADNPIQSGNDYLEAVGRYPLLADYTRDQWRYQVCHAFNNKGQETSGLALAEPGVPLLMLSGALDPITPSSWAAHLAQAWPRSQWVVRAQQAHSVLSQDICLLEQLKNYFDFPAARFEACMELN